MADDTIRKRAEALVAELWTVERDITEDPFWNIVGPDGASLGLCTSEESARELREQLLGRAKGRIERALESALESERMRAEKAEEDRLNSVLAERSAALRECDEARAALVKADADEQVLRRMIYEASQRADAEPARVAAAEEARDEAWVRATLPRAGASADYVLSVALGITYDAANALREQARRPGADIAALIRGVKPPSYAQTCSACGGTTRASGVHPASREACEAATFERAQGREVYADGEGWREIAPASELLAARPCTRCDAVAYEAGARRGDERDEELSACFFCGQYGPERYYGEAPLTVDAEKGSPSREGEACGVVPTGALPRPNCARDDERSRDCAAHDHDTHDFDADAERER